MASRGASCGIRQPGFLGNEIWIENIPKVLLPPREHSALTGLLGKHVWKHGSQHPARPKTDAA